MRVAIHQPEHLPWLGFFHKIGMADTYLILDNVQYRKNYFQNRNKIRTSNDWEWLTVPVRNRFGQMIKDVAIDNTSESWKRKYWKSIYYAYKKAPFFGRYSDTLKVLLDQEWPYIADMNTALISKFLEFLKIKPHILRASDMKAEGKGSNLILALCQEAGADVYISGISGKEYLDIEKFEAAGIEVIFQEFHHPFYEQLHEPFIPCMSCLDLLFNYGDKSIDVINGVGVPVMQDVFL